MADEPISALTLFTSYSTADEVEILDVSDTTFASTGTNKRIPFSTLLTMAGVGTAAGVTTVAEGGTGLTAVGSADQLLGVGHSGGALEYKTLTAGPNVTITPAAGSITIAASGGGGGLTVGNGISGGLNNAVLYENGSGNLAAQPVDVQRDRLVTRGSSRSSPSSPANIGFGAGAIGNVCQFQFDVCNYWRNTISSPLSISAYWGVYIYGNTQSTTFTPSLPAVRPQVQESS